MRISVRFFALQRSQTGLRRHGLDVPDGATVGTAWEALVAEMPVLADATESVRFARNGVYADRGEALAEGDELAVIPPVAGGGSESRVSDAGEDGSGGEGGAGGERDRSAERYRRIAIVESSLDEDLLAGLRADVPSPADGAMAMFVGQTRESPGSPAPGQEALAARFAGQRVSALSYEAFEPMAVAVLEAIADEIEARFGVRRLAILHRVGDVAVGEASVVIAAASPHREEAFSACRYAIEELKARAPIWKAEHFADGSVWLGAPARHGPADDEVR